MCLLIHWNHGKATAPCLFGVMPLVLKVDSVLAVTAWLLAWTSNRIAQKPVPTDFPSVAFLKVSSEHLSSSLIDPWRNNSILILPLASWFSSSTGLRRNMETGLPTSSTYTPCFPPVPRNSHTTNLALEALKTLAHFLNWQMRPLLSLWRSISRPHILLWLRTVRFQPI